MDKTTQFHNNLVKYLKQYGYDESHIVFEVKIPNDNKNLIVDAAIVIDNKILAVVEWKVNAQINGLDSKNLIISPFVMQLQTYANKLGASFYILTNGLEYVWFHTEENGRPQLVEPVKNLFNTNNNSSFFTVEDAIRACQTILRRDGASVNTTYELLLILLVQLDADIHVVNRILHFDINSELERLQRSTIDECKKIISMCKWDSHESHRLLLALDLLLSRNSYTRTYKIPLWLADFMIRLSDVNDHSIVHDPHANYGEILTALILSQKNLNTSYYFNTIEGALFAILVKCLLGKSFVDVHFSSQVILANKNMQQPDYVISALPFGHKVSQSKYYQFPFSPSELSDQIILSSLDNLKENGILTALVPESFLFSGGQRKQLREYLLRNYTLLHIVSLPVGTLSPYSNVKSSIIVIQKSQPKSEYDIRMSIIREPLLDNKDINSQSILVTRSILESVSSHTCNNEYTIEVPVTEIKDTITVDTYFDILNAPTIDYPLVPLKSICKSIVKGRNIKLSDSGDIKVIGPGSIRPFKIDPAQFNVTNSSGIGTKSIQVRPGDILLNAISTFLGAAAMVNEGIEGYASQHAIVITPDPKKISPAYLEIALNSKYVRNNIQNAISGSVIPSLNVTRVRELLIPIPSVSIQQKLIEEVGAIQSKIQILKEQLYKEQEAFNRTVDDLGIGEEDV